MVSHRATSPWWPWTFDPTSSTLKVAGVTGLAFLINSERISDIAKLVSFILLSDHTDSSGSDQDITIGLNQKDSLKTHYASL